MTRSRLVRNIILFLASAFLFGILEGGGHVTFGQPTLWIFVGNWHLPMAGLLLILAIGLEMYAYIPLWVLVEDMAYWIWSGHELQSSSWVSMALGGFSVFGIYLPWTYVLLLGLWGICVFIAWALKIIQWKIEI